MELNRFLWDISAYIPPAHNARASLLLLFDEIHPFIQRFLDLFFHHRGRCQLKQLPSQCQTRFIISGFPTVQRQLVVDCDYDIIDYLLDGRIVVLNMEGVSSSLAQRIIDFTYGGVYAIDGNFQGINSFIFVATPRNVDVSGDFVEDVISGKSPSTGNPSAKYQGYNGFRYND